jgi:hypothetical protein
MLENEIRLINVTQKQIDNIIKANEEGKIRISTQDLEFVNEVDYNLLIGVFPNRSERERIDKIHHGISVFRIR